MDPVLLGNTRLEFFSGRVCLCNDIMRIKQEFGGGFVLIGWHIDGMWGDTEKAMIHIVDSWESEDFM